MPPHPVPDRGFIPFSTSLLPAPIALSTGCQWKRGAATADLRCGTDKPQQTASVFTMVGLEATGVLKVLEDSWLASPPRLLCHCHLNGASYSFSTQSRMRAHSLLPSVPCCSFMGRTIPGDKWHNAITTRLQGVSLLLFLSTTLSSSSPYFAEYQHIITGPLSYKIECRKEEGGLKEKERTGEREQSM